LAGRKIKLRQPWFSAQFVVANGRYHTHNRVLSSVADWPWVMDLFPDWILMRKEPIRESGIDNDHQWMPSNILAIEQATSQQRQADGSKVILGYRLALSERFVTGRRIGLSGYSEGPAALNGCVNKRRITIGAGGFNPRNTFDFIDDAG
jgi:hypothetical protein